MTQKEYTQEHKKRLIAAFSVAEELPFRLGTAVLTLAFLGRQGKTVEDELRVVVDALERQLELWDCGIGANVITLTPAAEKALEDLPESVGKMFDTSVKGAAVCGPVEVAEALKRFEALLETDGKEAQA